MHDKSYSNFEDKCLIVTHAERIQCLVEYFGFGAECTDRWWWLEVTEEPLSLGIDQYYRPISASCRYIVIGIYVL